MEDDGAHGALRIHHESFGELHADRIFVNFKCSKKLLLIFEPRARRISEREALAMVMRLHEGLQRESGLVADSPHLANLEMQQFSERLSALQCDTLQDLRPT